MTSQTGFAPALGDQSSRADCFSTIYFNEYRARMTLNQVRQFAISLPETTEEPHFHYTSFRVHGKIFATAPPGDEFLHVFVPEDLRETAVVNEPDFVEKLRWGKRVTGLRVVLPSAKLEMVKTLLVQAWSYRAPKRLLASVDWNLM